MPFLCSTQAEARDALDDLINDETEPLMVLHKCRDLTGLYSLETLTGATENGTEPLADSTDPGLDLAAWVMYRKANT